MKYIRKIIYAVLCVIMVAALVIGMGVIFAVKNVNVTLISYSYEENSEKAVAQTARFKADILSKTRGTMISFVGDDAVSSAIGDSGYVVVSYEKVYPCTLNVTVRERRETFVVAESEESYSIYDESGLFLRKADSAEAALNKFDGEPNLAVTSDGANALDGEILQKIASACGVFGQKFNSARSVLGGVEITRTGLTFSFKSGVKLVIYDFGNMIEEKTEAAYNYFCKLSGTQKICGTIYCSMTTEGKVNVTYNGV